MRVAVIDCGTNTFNLLIADAEASNKIIYQSEKPVNLGEEGLNIIGQAAMQRAMNVLKQFADTCHSLEVYKVRAVGTAAFRIASNSQELVMLFKENTGIAINIINGDTEALLIYKGIVKNLPTNIKGNFLILDIGGGSCEFVIADENSIQWKVSLPLGASLLKDKYQINDPLTQVDIENMEVYIGEAIKNVCSELKNRNVNLLIGSSGSFDSLANIIYTHAHKTLALFNALDFDTLKSTIDNYTQLTLAQRVLIPGMKSIRAEMMPIAGVLISTVLKCTGIKNIYATQCALKEGLLLQVVEEHKVTLN